MHNVQPCITCNHPSLHPPACRESACWTVSIVETAWEAWNANLPCLQSHSSQNRHAISTSPWGSLMANLRHAGWLVPLGGAGPFVVVIDLAVRGGGALPLRRSRGGLSIRWVGGWWDRRCTIATVGIVLLVRRRLSVLRLRWLLLLLHRWLVHLGLVLLAVAGVVLATVWLVRLLLLLHHSMLLVLLMLWPVAAVMVTSATTTSAAATGCSQV
mmetsp:Transcript_20039/g.55745  ORF Transcript_20039/g.55745 Transcript_20039/m.55745 type:complete len:213 (+) Transcript_20039:1892-2530(+)